MTCSTLARTACPLWIGLAVLASQGCASSEPGVRVDITVSHHLGNAPQFEGVLHGAGEVRGLTNGLGYGIVIERAYVVMSEVELVGCPESGLTAALRWLTRIPTAHAHTAGSARVLGAPHVLDLMAADRTVLAQSSLQPPPGSYCGVRVAVAPADVDAVGLPEDVDMEGASLYLEGSFVAPGTDTSVEFALRSDLARDGEYALQRVAQGGGGVELMASDSPTELRLDLHYGRLFDEVALATQGKAEQGYFMVTNLLDDLAVIVCEPGTDCGQY